MRFATLVAATLCLGSSLLLTSLLFFAQRIQADEIANTQTFIPLIQNPLPNVVISEFMASNRVTVYDEDGDSSDWIELHNAQTSTARLTGWFLTDDRADLTKWQLPDLLLLPNERLLVFASGKDRTDAKVGLHTSFRLNSRGEYLALVASDGQTVASDYATGYPIQSPDVSYGLDAAGNQRYFLKPTPRGPNGSGQDDQGPALSQVVHSPQIPDAGEELVINATVGASAEFVTLEYRVMFYDEKRVPMFDDGNHADGAANDGIYGAIVPSSSYLQGNMVRYAVTATDKGDNRSRLPFNEDSDEQAQYFGTVVGAHQVQSDLPVLHWFVKRTRNAEKRTGTRASLFFDGRFYDNIFVRLRGGEIAEHWPKPNFKFDFPKGNFFAFSPDEEPVEEFNLNSTYSDKSYVRQILAWETYADAGVPSSISFPIRVHRNGKFHSVAIFIEQPDERYLARQGLDPNGALYKMESSLRSSDGEDKTGGASKRTRLHEGKSDFSLFVEGINQSRTARTNYLYDNVNIPAMVNYLAATVIMHDNDHVAKNYYLYRDSDDTKEWQMLPWDKDLTFGRNYTGNFRYLVDTIWTDEDPYSHPRFGDSSHTKVDFKWNKLIDALYDDPRIQEMMARRLRTLMDELLQPVNTPVAERHFEQRLAELVEQMEPDAELDRAVWGQPWGSKRKFVRAINEIKTLYLDPRRTHLYVTHGPPRAGFIPAAQPEFVQIDIGEHALDYTTPTNDAEYVSFTNPNDFAVDVSHWSVGTAISHTFVPGTVIAPGDTLYLSPNVVAFRNRVESPRGNEDRFVQGGYSGRLSRRPGTITLYDQNGVLVDSESYSTPFSPIAGRLDVTEINYGPPKSGSVGGAEFEFIELLNHSNKRIDLSAFRFIDGIEYLFPPGSVLPANGRLVLVGNRNAFGSRYPDIEVFGEYSKKLDNQGERVTLVDAQGMVVFTFSYGVEGTWPNIADSQGRSMVRVDVNLSADDPCSWRVSTEQFGSPAVADPSGQQNNCLERLFLPTVQMGS